MDARDRADDIETEILNEVYGIDLSDGLDETDLAGFGRNDADAERYNPLYDEDGNLRDPVDTIEFFEAVLDFLDALDASDRADDIETEILLEVYGIYLSNSLDETDLARSEEH